MLVWFYDREELVLNFDIVPHLDKSVRVLLILANLLNPPKPLL